MKRMRKPVIFLFILAVVGAVGAFYAGGDVAAINFETGFWSALLVVGASMLGYWQMVSGSDGSKNAYETQDAVDSVDDRYGLWEESDLAETVKAADDRDTNVSALMKEERAKLKKSRRSFGSILKSAKPAISIYRLAAYIVLILGVIWLMEEGLFDPVFYFFGAGSSPLALALWLYLTR